MLSPIATLVKVSGETAVLSVPAVADSSDYNPNLGGVFAPAAPVTTGLRGVYSMQEVAGIVPKGVAMFLTDNTTMTPPPTEQATLNVGGKVYVVLACDPRRYLGALDGYNLHLGA